MSLTTAETMSFRAKLGFLFFLATLFFICFMSRVILGPMLPTVEADLGINHTRSGSMFFMISLGLSLASLGSGLVNSRIGHRGTIMVSFLGAGLSLTIASQTRTLIQLDALLLFVGLGAGLYIPSAIITITSVISQKNWSKAISVHELAPNLGLLLTPLIVEALLRFTTWRNVPAPAGFVHFRRGSRLCLPGARGGRSRASRPASPPWAAWPSCPPCGC